MIFGISAYLFLMSFEEKQFINLGNINFNDDQRDKIFKEVKPFMQFLSLSLFLFGFIIAKVWGENAAGFFLGFYPLVVFATGVYLMPGYVSKKHTKLSLICSLILFGLSLPFIIKFILEIIT